MSDNTQSPRLVLREVKTICERFLDHAPPDKEKRLSDCLCTLRDQGWTETDLELVEERARLLLRLPQR